jgi:hypothetical protein
MTKIFFSLFTPKPMAFGCCWFTCFSSIMLSPRYTQRRTNPSELLREKMSSLGGQKMQSRNCLQSLSTIQHGSKAIAGKWSRLRMAATYSHCSIRKSASHQDILAAHIEIFSLDTGKRGKWCRCVNIRNKNNTCCTSSEAHLTIYQHPKPVQLHTW